MKRRIKASYVLIVLTVLSVIFMFGTGLEIFLKEYFKLSTFVSLSLVIIDLTVITFEYELENKKDDE